MRTFSIFLLVLMVAISCRNQELIRPGDTLDVAFDKAYGLFEEEQWTDAARGFETVVSIGRGTITGQDAQYYLAESYYNAGQYLVAASEYERYASFYPNSQRRAEVDYKQALCYHQLSPRYNLDQTHTYRAIELFQLYMARFPNAEYVEEAGERIDELLNKLARKKYEAGNFYLRSNRQYRAAAVTFEQVLENYPGTDWAEHALARQIEAYILYADNSIPERRAERYDMAIESYQRYLQLFPSGENRQRVEELYDRARLSYQEVTDGESGVDSESLTADRNEP
ncbi:MAG: outer membrane protein assembly factor BamD [Balneolaceae bacterium]